MRVSSLSTDATQALHTDDAFCLIGLSNTDYEADYLEIRLFENVGIRMQIRDVLLALVVIKLVDALRGY